MASIIHYNKNVHLLKKYNALACISLLCAVPFASHSAYADIGAGVIPIEFELGPMADYGASPWYTTQLKVGSSDIKFTFDSGASFIWATSDQCNTPACNAHDKVNTSQSGFVWIDQERKKRPFGPWGDMYTWTGKVPFNLSAKSGDMISSETQFFASVEYEGSKFQDLAWDGGVGFPSRSDAAIGGTSFYLFDLWRESKIAKPEFSVVTDKLEGTGTFYLGGDDPSRYISSTLTVLEPKLSSIGYLWGTELHSLELGGQALPALEKATFFLDTGSSRFKGDAEYVYPILEVLYGIKDKAGNMIFEKYYENGIWTELYYKEGGPESYVGLLPYLTINIGQVCAEQTGQVASISLSPDQYSYKVQEGDRSGEYVVAVHRLDGVGGLLVGSTFTDLMYTKFSYEIVGDALQQGNMNLYQKSSGEQPASFNCRPLTL